MTYPNTPTMTSAAAAILVALLIAVLAPAPAALAANSDQAGDYSAGPMQITQPWARATSKGAATGAAYMTITNTGTAPDRVACVSDDASAQCQIHSTTMTGGVMQMRPVEGGLEIKPGETVTFKPGGYHVMFVDLKHPLVQGQAVRATLKFDRAGSVDVVYPIAGIGAPAPGEAVGGGGMRMNKP